MYPTDQSARESFTLSFSTMPELATGLSNIFIVISAALCLVSLPRRRELREWRLFFALTGLAAVCGLLVHCLVLPEPGERLLWIGFDLCIMPALAALALAGRGDLRGPAPLLLRRLLWLAAAAGAGVMILRLLRTGDFGAQFPVAAVLGAASVASYLLCLLLGRRLRPRQTSRGLLGMVLLLALGLPWLLGGEFVLRLGPLLLNQSAVLHIGAALALPLFRLSAGDGR